MTPRNQQPRKVGSGTVTKTQLIIGAVIAGMLLTGYVIVTVTNHDGTALLTALVGWLAGVGVAPATRKAADG